MSNSKSGDSHGGPRRGSGRKPFSWTKHEMKTGPITVPKFMKSFIYDVLERMWPLIKEAWERDENSELLKEEIFMKLLLEKMGARWIPNDQAEEFFREGFPFFDEPVAATFGQTESPDFSDRADAVLDLNSYIADKSREKGEIILIPVVGTSMIDASISPNDLLVVEIIRGTYIEPSPGAVVIAYVDGSPTVKRYYKDNRGNIQLVPNNFASQEHVPIVIDSPDIDFELVGIVRSVIHDV